MFKCKRCGDEAVDGITCSVCDGQFDFPCSGITERGYNRLGERKHTWKCASCKAPATATASPCIKVTSPVPADYETILLELKRMSAQMESLPALVETVKAIQIELEDLKAMRSEFSEVKHSFEFACDEIKALSGRVSLLEKEAESMKKTKEELSTLQDRIFKLEEQQREYDQRSRINNIEIKGVPMSNDENLFTLVAKIGETINCHIPREQINYIARVPTRNDKQDKNIICSVHNSYLKNDFVAAARKHKNLNTGNLGLRGDSKIYVNHHLTLENKILLNKTKALAKERGFESVWVTSCKIFLRKNPTSPKHHIKTERDIKKFLC